MWQYIKLSRDREVPQDSMKIGVDLSRAPHVIATLIGEFKGELGMRRHLIALANDISLGILLRWWLEQLLHIREEERCRTGPAFGNSNRSVGLMPEYDNMLHFFLQKVQDAHPNLILPTDNVDANYGFSCTFRRMAKGRARGANLDSGVQNAMNRWRKIKEAKGKCSQFNMADHYSNSQELMPVTRHYSFVQ
jgi:hypothetical protein